MKSLSAHSLLFIFFLLITFSIPASDNLEIAEDFQEGDVISAETFNQIFDTIEKVNRIIVKDDLYGTWTCDTVKPYGGTGYIEDGILYLLEGSTFKFETGIEGTTPVSTLNTSNLNPISNTAYSGYFDVRNNVLFLKSLGGGSSTYDLNFVTLDKFHMNQSNTFITCNSSIAIPNSPSSPSVKYETSLNSIELTWTDRSNDETGFKVFRKNSSEDEYSLVSTQTGNKYIDSDFIEGETYFYYVVSYNDNGDSSKTKVVSLYVDTTKPTVIASLPTEGQEWDINNKNVTIKFSERVNYVGAINYQDCSSAPIIMVGTEKKAEWEDNEKTYCRFFLQESNAIFQGLRHSYKKYTVTVNKEFIVDFSGNKMEEDYTFSFTSD